MTTELAKRISCLIDASHRIDDDIQYYSGGSTHNNAKDALTDLVLKNANVIMDYLTTETITVTYDPNYPYFGLVSGPVEHKQHPNQQSGLDQYVHVINLQTGEPCFKKLYENKTGLHFKHTGYSSMYLKNFTETGSVIPFQTKNIKGFF